MKTITSKKTVSFFAQSAKFLMALIIVCFASYNLKAQTAASYGCIASSGTYTPITGTFTTVTAVSGQTYAYNSPLQTIGFTFPFCGSTYTTLGISGDGFIKLGGVTSLSLTNPYNPLNVAAGGPRISPFGGTYSAAATYYTLGEGLSPKSGDGQPADQIVTQVTGVAPNRVYTIEWQNWGFFYYAGYNFISYECKLYETTGEIQFVYKPGAYGATNIGSTNSGINVGIETANTSGNYMVVYGVGATAWSAPSTTSTLGANQVLNYGTASNFTPTTGLTYTIQPLIPNDAAVNILYSLGELPLNFGAPHVITAIVQNVGSGTRTSLPVTLNITGANTFTNTQTIASLASGASTTVTFAGFTPTTTGADVVTVSVPSDGNNSNNSQTWNQQVTSNLYSYKNQSIGNTGGVGFTGATGDFVAKFTTAVANTINQIKVDFSASGQPYQIGIWDNTGAGGIPGTNLWTSATLTSAIGTDFVTVPNIAVSGSFYVGVRQTGTTNVSFSYQTESPIRPSTFYYTSPTGSTTWTDFAPANPFRFSIEVGLFIPVAPNCVVNPQPANGLTDQCFTPTLTWQSGGGAPTGYDVYFSTNQAQVNSLNAAALVSSNQAGLSYSPPTLAANTTYYWTVVARNAVGTATGCSVQSFTTGSLAVCYCTSPVYSVGTVGCTDDIYINNFSFAGINNANSGCNSVAPYYTNYPTQVGSAGEGLNYTVAISAPTNVAAFNQYFAVFIDFNDNGSFDDAGENIYNSGLITTTTNSVSATVTMPTGKPAGIHRLRVRSANAVVNSCSTDGVAGEVEDYKINLVVCSVAPTTLNGATSLCTSGTATLSQTGGSLGTNAYWQWYQDAAYTIPVGGQLSSATASITVSPTVTTTYYLRAEGNSGPCGAITAGPSGGVTVTVNTPSVAPTTLNGATSYCASGTATISQTGGSLGTGAYWQWYSDAAYTVAVGSQLSSANASLTVSPTTTTTYYLRAEGASAPCTAIVAGPSGGVTVTVNAIPTGSASNASICSGTQTNISLSSTVSGSSFTWTGAQQSGATVTGGGSGSGTSIQQTLTNSGNTVNGVFRYTVTPTSPSGCVGSNFIVDATVKPTPVASSSVYPGEFLCGDGASSTNIDLNSSTGASTYTWTSTASSGVTGNSNCSSGCSNPIADVLSNSASTDGTATYTIIPTSGGGCVGGAYTIVENIGAIPVTTASGSTTICSGSAMNTALTSTVSGTSYTWFSYMLSGTLTGNVDCGGGCANSITDVLVNTGTTDAVIEYDISSVSATGCPGADILVDITVHPSITVTCPGNQTATTTSNSCNATVNYTASSSGNPSPVLTYSFAGATTGSGSGSGSGSLFNLGVTTVTLTATNSCGAPTCTFTVTVSDNINPTIATNSNITQTSDAGVCTAVVTFASPAAADNCSISSVVCTPASGSTFPLGATTVTCVATDGSGNTATSAFTVTVTDNQNPTIATNSNITQTSDAGVCTAVVTFASPTAADNCSVSSVVCTPPSGSTFPLGATTVTCVATDGSGNMASSAFTVTVTDNQNPTIATNSNITQTSDAGVCTAVVTYATPATSDNCSVSSVVCTPASGSTFPSGTTTVTCVATDGSGNTATSSFTVTVTDNQNPTIVASANVNTTTNSGCTATGVNLGTPTTADNCSVASTTNNAPTVFPLGNTTVTWTVTDGAGNTATATQVVTVTDNVNPTITAPATVNATTNSGCTATGVNLGTPTTADNCSVASTTNNAPTAFPLGNTTVTWTVTDGSGNTATATQVVTVTDNVNPTITAPADVTVCNGASITLGTPTTADNCSVASVTNNAPSSYPVGTTVVTWTVTDGSGNTATATQNVTVNAVPVGTGTSIVICNGDPVNASLSSTITGSTFTWTQQVTTGSVIGSNDCSSGCGNVISDILTNLGNVHGVVQYTVTPTSPLGCVGTPFVINVTVGAVPAAPVISGPSVVCQITNTTYSCAAVPEATSYTWTVPTGVTGMTINSGQGTTSINVTISAGTVTGNVTCTASNNCGSSTTTSLSVTKKPVQPGAITGPTSVCGQTTATYSIAPVFGATSYSWTMPTGMTLVGGAGTTQITVSISSSFVMGLVKVAAVNACGNVQGINLTVYGNVPIAPVSISGPTAICGLSTGTYTTPTVTGATGYNWVATGGVTIVGPITGQSVNVTYSGTTGGTISVAATNVCGIGPYRNLTLTATPAQPGVISGPAYVCNAVSAQYSVPTVAGVTSYNWTVPASMGTIPPNSTSNTITITFATTFTNASSGAITVTETSQCGTSTQRNLTIAQTQIPATPVGPSNVSGLTTTTYRIPVITNATDYIWAVSTSGTSNVAPTNVKIQLSGGQLVSTYTSNGNTDTVITVVFIGTSGNYTGNDFIRVAAQYNCVSRTTNTSAYKTLPIQGVALNPNGMENNGMFSNIYPNPTTNEFLIDVTSDVDEDIVVEVYDILGNKVVEQKHFVTIGDSSIKTNVESFESGMYFVRLRNTNGDVLYTQRVIKQ